MANKNSKTNIKDERIEDNTMYGEFILPSSNGWRRTDSGELPGIRRTSRMVPGDSHKGKKS